MKALNLKDSLEFRENQGKFRGMSRFPFVLIKNSTAAVAGMSLVGTGFTLSSPGISKEIGIQLYTLAQPLSEDFPGTLEKLAKFGYKAAAELYNQFGERCKSAGIRYGYHTHSHEFGNYDGLTPFEVLVQNTDPDLVCFELDLFWATLAGIDPVNLIHKYPGRIKLLHIKEMTQKMDRVYNTNEPFTNMEIGGKIFNNQTIIGEGIIDFEGIISQVNDSGIEHIIIESDFPSEPMKFAEKSILNLKKVI